MPSSYAVFAGANCPHDAAVAIPACQQDQYLEAAMRELLASFEPYARRTANT